MGAQEISSELPYYLAGQVRQQLMKGYQKVTKGDQDRIYIVTGREGTGKSTLALQLAYVVDNTLSLNNICFNAHEVRNRIRNTPKFKAIIFDEAFNGLSSKGALSKENKELVRLLMECRQRNLFIFIVLPSFFLLEKYPAIFRSHALFNVIVSRKNYMRRHYKIYNYTAKKKLYILGKKLMDHSRPYVAMSYRFYGKFPPTINKEEYLKKKLDAFRETGYTETEESNYKQQRGLLLHYLNTKHDMQYTELEKLFNGTEFGIKSNAIGKICRTYAKISKK